MPIQDKESMTKILIKIHSGLWFIMKDLKWESINIDYLLLITISNNMENLNLIVLKL